MKIIIIGPAPPIRGGIADTSHSLGNLLAEKNDVTILSFKRLYPSFFFGKKQSTNPEKSNYVKHEMLDGLNPWTWKKSADFILNEKPDVVIFQWWTTYLFLCYGYMASRLKNKVRMGGMIHNTYPHGVDA